MFLVDQILKYIVPMIFRYLRPIIKWFLFTFTRLHELQRICYGAAAGASRTKQVEKSLRLSNKEEIKALIRQFDEEIEYCNEQELRMIPVRAVTVVQRVKRIKSRSHPDFGPLFGACILQIWSYRRLVVIVERLRSEQYDSNNLEHETKLLNLWLLLMPQEPLVARISKQWQEIGFQGDDPKTDFRGMGLLGLENLLFFAREYNHAAQHVLLHSMHPVHGYTFAIVGINLTAMAYRLLRMECAQTHFYNVAQSAGICNLEQFHRFYCYLFFEFDRFWKQSEPTNIMDFRDIYQRFEITIMEALQNNSTMFKTNLVVEDI